MPSYIQTSTAKLMEGNFTIRANNIITGMDQNPDFPEPPHNIRDVVVPKFNAYKALCKEAYLMSRKDYDDRNALRKELDTMFRDNGLYVIARFPQDRNKQVGSNYEPVKEPDRSGMPAVPTGIHASTGNNNGELKLYWNSIRNARGYNLKYRINGDNDDPWQYKSVSKSRGVVIEGLQSGVMYEVWVQAIGAKKDSDYGGPGEARAK